MIRVNLVTLALMMIYDPSLTKVVDEFQYKI